MAWTSDGNTTNRYIKWRLSWSESSVNQANNTSKVTVKLYVRRTNTGYTTYGNGTAYIWIDGTKYSGSITTSTKITHTEKCILTKSKTITHNSNGSKSITIAGDISHSQFDATYKSWSINLTTIPRASSISSISGNTIGSPITVNISRKASSFTHTVDFYIGSTKISSWTKVATKQTFTPDMSTCCSKITNASSASARIDVTTYNGSTKIGSTVSKTFTLYVPSSVVPSISNFTITPSNSNSLLKDSGLYVQGYTKYTASITAAGIYGSTISKYATSGGGTSTASASATSGIIDTSGAIQITATVTDSRGRTASVTSDVIEVIPYYKPSITTNIYRCDENGYEDDGGNNVYITILSKDFSSINGLNSITSIKVQYKKSTDDDLSWSNSISITGTDLMIENLSSDFAYDLRFIITDAMGETTTFITNVKTEKVMIDFYNGGLGVSFGKVSSQEGLNSNWDFILENQKYIKGVLPSGDLENIIGTNESGQIEINWTSGGMKGRMFKQLWKGTWSSGSITIPDLPYYKFFLFQQSGGYTMIPVFRYLNANSQNGSVLRGFGGHAYKSSAGDRSFLLYAFDGDISGGDNGTSLTFGAAYAFSIYETGGNPANKSDLSILSIYGVL